MSRSVLQRQRTCGGLGSTNSPRSIGGGGGQGFSTDSQQSTKSCLNVPSSLAATPLLRHQVSADGRYAGGAGAGSTPQSKREVFKWSGVTVSFDADSVKIENEVNGGLSSGIKSIGKEVRYEHALLYIFF